MFEWTRLATFMLASTLLIVVPGPAVLYVVARSIDQGKWRALSLYWELPWVL